MSCGREKVSFCRDRHDGRARRGAGLSFSSHEAQSGSDLHSGDRRHEFAQLFDDVRDRGVFHVDPVIDIDVALNDDQRGIHGVDYDGAIRSHDNDTFDASNDNDRCAGHDDDRVNGGP